MYRDRHVFPNGFEVQYRTEFTYVSEIRSAKSIDELKDIINKYKYIFPEFIYILQNINCFDFFDFKRASTDLFFQQLLVYRFENKQKIDDWMILEILIPRTSLLYFKVMNHFGVPFGVAVMQTWNAELIDEKDGFWFHKMIKYAAGTFELESASLGQG